MAKRIRRTQILDAVSGELLSEERQTIYTSEMYRPGEGYRLYSRKHTRLGDWDKPLDVYTEGVLSIILRTMDGNNLVADVGELSGRFGVTDRRVYQMLSSLRKKGLIAKVDGGYAVNPAVAFAGTYLSPPLYRLFEPDLTRIVPNWAKLLYDKEEAASGEVPEGR